MDNIIQKIIDNKDKIVGIRINEEYYEWGCVCVDDQYCYDQFSPSDVIIYNAYQIDVDKGVIRYNFTVEDIKNANKVKLYKLEEI